MVMSADTLNTDTDLHFDMSAMRIETNEYGDFKELH